MSIERVGIVGAGLMGAGIAQVCVTHDVRVLLVDSVSGAAERAHAAIARGLTLQAARNRMTPDAVARALERLTIADSLEEIGQADLVIEAIVEQLELKRALFARIGKVALPQTILASNTSSLPLSELAAASGQPDRVVGLHFFNPPYALRLVEVVPSESTGAETLTQALAFCDALDRITVQVKDAPEFIVNRLLVPYIFDAIHLLDGGISTAEDIDRACTSGLSHAMGPLATADLIGLDTLLFISEAMFAEFGEPRFKAPIALRRLVSLGHLGRKTGHGFYRYPAADPSTEAVRGVERAS